MSLRILGLDNSAYFLLSEKKVLAVSMDDPSSFHAASFLRRNLTYLDPIDGAGFQNMTLLVSGRLNSFINLVDEVSINTMNILLSEDEILNTCKNSYRRRKQNGTGPKPFDET